MKLKFKVEEIWTWRNLKLKIFEVEEIWIWSKLKLNKFEVEEVWNWRNLKSKEFELEEIWSWGNLKLKKFEVEEIWAWRNLKLKKFEVEENKWLGVWWWEMRAEEYYKYRKLGLIYLETWIQRELEVMIFKSWRHSKIRLKRLIYWGWARPNSAQAWARY